MNQLILLKDETQSFERPDRIVRLEVKNISTEKICFPIGQNITLLYFEEKNQEWVELANKTHYLSLRDEIILEPSGDLGDVSIISARPVLEINSHGKTEIRIVVWGEICEKESLQNKEGAYIDITMN